MNIVGLALVDADLKARMEGWAAITGGSFFDAQDPEGLSAGIAAALQAPFAVYDKAGEKVAAGVVGGPSLPLPPGTYRVEVLSDPPIVFDDVRIGPGEGVELTVGDAGP